MHSGNLIKHKIVLKTKGKIRKSSSTQLANSTSALPAIKSYFRNALMNNLASSVRIAFLALGLQLNRLGSDMPCMETCVELFEKF